MGAPIGEKHGKKTHGAWSIVQSKNYSIVPAEVRQQLEAVRTNLIEDLGGKDCNQGILILVDRIIEKLMVLSCISEYCCKKESLIDPETNQLISCLNKNYIGFSNALRLDIQLVYTMANKTPDEGQGLLDNYLKRRYGSKIKKIKQH